MRFARCQFGFTYPPRLNMEALKIYPSMSLTCWLDDSDNNDGNSDPVPQFRAALPWFQQRFRWVRNSISVMENSIKAATQHCCTFHPIRASAPLEDQTRHIHWYIFLQCPSRSYAKSLHLIQHWPITSIDLTRPVLSDSREIWIKSN